jgi:peroxiredoxin
MEEERRPRILLAALSVITLVVFGAVIYLWRQHAAPRNRARNSADQPTSIHSKRMSEGIELPEFIARDTQGREARIAARGNGITLLFIFNPACDRCEAGMPAWIKVSKKLAELQSNAHVIALSTADSYTAVQYARRKKLPFPVAPFPSAVMQRLYGVIEVPLTVVVDAKGIVRAVWDKPLDEGEVADVVETACPECVKRAADSAR